MRERIIVFTIGITLAFSLILLQGCGTENKLTSLIYFNEKGDTSLSKIIQNSEPVMQAGDRLQITVNALDPASAAPYNLGSAVTIPTSTNSSLQASAGGNSGNTGYIVEANGTIHFPQLGKIAVSGLQRKQLVDLLTEKLTKFVNDPIVTVQFLNFKITLLGEVTKPGTINIPEGKVTLVEAIGLAGDLPLTARRDNIMIIREKNGQREFGYVNILSKNAFSSPYYILKQNDIVYVEVTKEKVMAADVSSAKLRSNISLVTTALAIISTVVVLIINFKK